MGTKKSRTIRWTKGHLCHENPSERFSNKGSLDIVKRTCEKFLYVN